MLKGLGCLTAGLSGQGRPDLLGYGVRSVYRFMTRRTISALELILNQGVGTRHALALVCWNWLASALWRLFREYDRYTYGKYSVFGQLLAD